MGELFRKIQPDTSLAWTGERMVTSQTGDIEAEHFHRYFLARELCRGLAVLDVASGEGYGSAFLAQTAHTVVGVEIDPQSVEHATSTYRSSNLQYIVGSAAKLPIDDRSVDAVVSFETIEHLCDHRQFLTEVKRVLRTGGFLLISTPDMNVYSAPKTEPNPFHVRELTDREFRAALLVSFRNVRLIRQRAISGSAIVPDTIDSGTDSLSIFEQRDRVTFETAPGLLRAPYLLAVASDQTPPSLGVSLFIQGQYGGEIARVTAELKEARTRYEAELRTAAERTYQEWSQRIQAEEAFSKVSAELTELKHRYDLDLQAAAAKTHLEWSLHVRTEEELRLAREQTDSERTQRLGTETELTNTRSELSKVKEHLRLAEGELAKLSAKLSETESQAAFYDAELHRALNSRSWKITSPLRAVSSILKRRLPTARDGNGLVAEERIELVVTESNTQPDIDATSECGVPRGQQAWDRYGQARLKDLLAGERCLDFGANDHPLVSLILVLFNEAHLSLLALESILTNCDVDYELLIVDNASTDETGSLLERIRGAHIIKNTQNVGFGPACIQGAEAARATYLCFLNNDALLEPHAMSKALANFSRSESVGVVGGKILLADGRMQEAGSIVWSDGSALGYGRSDDPALHAYEFRRPVDYCSGAFLFTPRCLFFELGGFREDFAPGYYEDTDYCMRVWSHGLEVIYEPCSVIRHFESASSGGNEIAKPRMAAKQLKFVELWKESLPNHLAPTPSNILRARIATSFPGLRILYVDDRVPHRELGSGFPRSNDVLQHIVRQGHQISFMALSFPPQQPSDEYRDIPREVELVDGTRKVASILHKYLPVIDVMWVSRPHNMERCLTAIAEAATPNRIPIIYDAEAIFADRDRLKAQIEGRKISQQILNGRSAMERALAQVADVTLAVCERDAKSLEALGLSPVKVLGHRVEPVPTGNSFAERTHFLFVGAIHDGDNPNLDSLRYFCRDVWPAVWESTKAEFIIAGFGSDQFTNEFRIPGVTVVGPRQDTRPLYESARVFVVPTRYCAGIPYKAHEAAAHGVPMVVTPIIRDQLLWTDGKDCLVGEGPAQFSDLCIKLFRDVSLWSAVRDNALSRVGIELSPNAFDAAIADILANFRAPASEQRSSHRTSLAASL